jgi:hypothetical protein
MSADDGGKEGGKEGGQQQGGAKQAGRGKAMTYPELMCCMWAVLGTNERFSGGKPTEFYTYIEQYGCPHVCYLGTCVSLVCGYVLSWYMCICMYTHEGNHIFHRSPHLGGLRSGLRSPG